MASSDNNVFIKQETDGNLPDYTTEIFIKLENEANDFTSINENERYFKEESIWTPESEVKLESKSNDAAYDEDDTHYSHINPSDYLQTDMQVSDEVEDTKNELFFHKSKPVQLTTLNSTLGNLNQKVTCYYCNFKTKSRKKLETHILEHFNWKAKVISRKTNENSLREQVDSKKEFLVCVMCGYKTTCRYRMKIHMIRHTGEKPFTCSICNLSSFRKWDLIKHLRTHSGYRPFMCNECTYSASRKSTLSKHIMRRHGKQKLSEMCATNLSEKSENTKTCDGSSKMYSTTDFPDKPFVCNKCSFTAFEKSTMKLHVMRFHTGERPFLCSACNFRTITNYNLKRHFNRVHAGNKPFPCNLCSFRGVTNYHLSRHLGKVHVNTKPIDKSSDQLKPISCAHCYFRTTSNSSLSRHFNKVHAAILLNDTINEDKSLKIVGNDGAQNINTADEESLKMYKKSGPVGRPFACIKCSFTAPTKSKIKLHIMRVHTYERPFSCSDCSFKTTTNYHLKRHFSTVHSGEKSYPCSLCTFKTISNYHLKRHITQVHLSTHIDLSTEQHKPILCIHCGFATTTNSSLTRHFNAMHAATLVSRHMSSCENNSITPLDNNMIQSNGTLGNASIEISSKMDSEQSPLMCSECPFTTSARSEMKLHIMTLHTDEISFSCGDCNYETSTISNLKKHFNSVHSRVKLKPFACNKCNFISDTSNDLDKHISEMHGRPKLAYNRNKPKPFCCLFCPYRASTKYIMSRHIIGEHATDFDDAQDKPCQDIKLAKTLGNDPVKNITGTPNINLNSPTKRRPRIKRFICSECPFKAPTKSKMKLHVMRLHTGEKPFSCSACNFKTTTNYHLKRHFYNVHKKNVSI